MSSESTVTPTPTTTPVTAPATAKSDDKKSGGSFWVWLVAGVLFTLFLIYVANAD